MQARQSGATFGRAFAAERSDKYLHPQVARFSRSDGATEGRACAIWRSDKYLYPQVAGLSRSDGATFGRAFAAERSFAIPDDRNSEKAAPESSRHFACNAATEEIAGATV